MSGNLLRTSLIVLLAGSVAAGCSGSSRDYDVDDDGLIEVSFIEQLDAIRWDLNGDGEADAGEGLEGFYAEVFPDALDGMGCPRGVCAGYELARSLDFEDAGSFASGEVDDGSGHGDDGSGHGDDGSGHGDGEVDVDASDEGGVDAPEGEGWWPIGHPGTPFRGDFDGGDFTISNLFIDRSTLDYAGLFGQISGSVYNLNLVGVWIKGADRVGGLAGSNLGRITKVYIAGDVSSFSEAAGLVGVNRGNISRSGATVNVSSTQVAAGLVSVHYGRIDDSYSAGSVSADVWLAGGLVALSYGEISGSHSSSEVSAAATAGGIAAFSNGQIADSNTTGSVTARSDSAGGLVALNYGELTRSRSSAWVSGNHRVGGLVGFNSASGEITASYFTGSVSGDICIGGLVGWNSGMIEIEHSEGDVSGYENDIGVVGEGQRDCPHKLRNG